MAAIGLFQEARNLFQVMSTLNWQSQITLQSESESPLSNGMWAVKVVQREDRITSSVYGFPLNRDLMAHVWKENGF